MNKNAAIFIIGNELTRGIIQDKYAKMISCDLDLLGFKVQEIFIERDDKNIENRITEVSKNCSLIITTGGLGPTEDDKTRFIISASSKCELKENPKALQCILNIAKNNVNNNLVQSYIPFGFEVFDNPNGTAAGFAGKGKNDCVYICFPGPPKEMYPMYDRYFKIFIKKQFSMLPSEILECSLFGYQEADFEKICKETKQELQSSIEVGTRYQEFKISVFLQGGEKTEREKFFKVLEKKLGSVRFLKGNLEISEVVINHLASKGLTIATAESITGGLVSKLLTDVAGSSKTFLSGAVTYSDSAKIKVLGVDEKIISQYSAVSSQCSCAMSEGVSKLYSSDIGLSTTGYAGPSGKEVGKVFTSVYYNGKTYTKNLSYNSQLDRNTIRAKVAVDSLIFLQEVLYGKSDL